MKVSIDVRVTFSTPFNVGSGALADSLADKPTVKDVAHVPVLPGSSLKGRTRHECERIVRALIGDVNAVCHGPNPDNMCPLDPARMHQKHCPVCCIFGSPWLPSRARFPDLRWELREEFDVERPPATCLRYGVSISRTRRVAEENRLFTTETFAPTATTTFVGQIKADFPDDQEPFGQVGLLVAGLRAITSLGGGRSRGLGWCKVEATPLEIVDGEERAIGDDALKEGLGRWLKLT